MKNLKEGQKVTVPNGRVGTVRRIRGREVIVWFDNEGNDTGIFAITTLIYAPSNTLTLI